MSRSSQAVTEIDRRDEYIAKPAHRARPDFTRQFLRGEALKNELARKWAKRPERTNPDTHMERN